MKRSADFYKVVNAVINTLNHGDSVAYVTGGQGGSGYGVFDTNEDTENILLSVCADGWSGGSNVAALKAAAQKLDGAVKVGSDSSLTLELTDSSTFEGYIDGNITNAKGGTVSTEAGEVSVTLDDSSTWTLTGDSYVTEFNGNAANVISNGYTLYVNGTALTEAQ